MSFGSAPLLLSFPCPSISARGLHLQNQIWVSLLNSESPCLGISNTVGMKVRNGVTHSSETGQLFLLLALSYTKEPWIEAAFLALMVTDVFHTASAAGLKGLHENPSFCLNSPQFYILLCYRENLQGIKGIWPNDSTIRKCTKEIPMLLFSTDLYFNPTGQWLRISSKESECLIMSNWSTWRQWKEPSPWEHQNRFILVWGESLKEQMVLFYHELDPASIEAHNWWTFASIFF